MSDGRVPLDLRGLSGEIELFRLSNGSRCDTEVQAWLNTPSDLRVIARKWFSHIRDCGEDVLELMHDGCPVACVEDAAFAYVNTFKSHVNVGFFHGALLDDPAGLLIGSGKHMRHVKLLPGVQANDLALAELIHAAYRDIKSRLD